MKVKNTEIRSSADVVRILEPMTPGIDFRELVACNRVMIRVNRTGCGLRSVPKADGISFKFDKEEIVNPERGSTKVVDSIRFGIRTDGDGMLDMGKLAAKFNDNRDRILEFLVHEAKNAEERARRRDELYRKFDVSKSLVEEGLLDPMEDCVEETDSTYRVTLVLDTDEELREVAEFYKALKERRTVTA